MQDLEPASGKREAKGRVTRKRSSAAARVKTKTPTRGAASRFPSPASLVDQLDAIQASGGSGTLRFPKGATLAVTNLDKVFFPQDGYTKGDLMRFYARMSSFILPHIADRPLVLKRYPNGIDGESFYQQRAAEDVPDGVRVEVVKNDVGEEQRRLIGGDLLTLLYTVQLGAISVDPWHSRVQTCDFADYTVLDLDPGPRARFERVVDVARWVKDELDAVELRAAIKTSGATGLHIFVPLPPKVANEAALLLAQLIATRVAEKHPREATIERSVKARPPATVYVDYLQNIRGKTVAGVYAARARKGASVSVPLDWKELSTRLDPRDFTIETVPDRAERLGDVWGMAMKRRNTAAAIRKAADL